MRLSADDRQPRARCRACIALSSDSEVADVDVNDRTITGLRAARQLLDRAFDAWSARTEHSAEVIDLDQWRRRPSA